MRFTLAEWAEIVGRVLLSASTTFVGVLFGIWLGHRLGVHW